MQKIYTKNSSRILKGTIFLLIAAIILSACKSKNVETDLEPTLEATPTIQIESTQAAPQIVTSGSPTPTLLPATPGANAASQAGLIIFSMVDGEYKHLFAYHPSYMSITRLTSDAWDDEYPVVSPDGTRIAFTSNRFGIHDIFILDLVNNSLSQMTNSSAYESRVSWSNDGNYIAYDVYQNEHYVLVIQSVTDLSEAPIQLTDESSNSFQPSWSPDGSQLAFVTDRSGRNEIWTAKLHDPSERFIKIIGSLEADFYNPVWSPDGSSLAFSKHDSNDNIMVVNVNSLESDPVDIGYGSSPSWMPDGSGILATIQQPNQTEIIAYAVADRHLMLPPIKMSGILSGYDWKSGNLYNSVQGWVSRNALAQPAALWADEPSVEIGENGRRSLVDLQDVEAPQPSLSDAVDDSFIALRSLVEEKTGWDFLGTLENATLPPTSKDTPGIAENWLYTGRAIAVNLAPYEAEWMVVTREEFAGELYWRVWVKCKAQDGTCGKPIDTPIWDFNSRYSGDILAYENGGRTLPAPSGYWVDFTDLALRFGWERLPSLNNWRSYFQGIQFNVFVLKQQLSWTQALLEIYPPDQVAIILGSEE